MPTPRDRIKSISHLSPVPTISIDNDTVITEYVRYRRTTGRKPWRPETTRVRTYQLHRIADQLAPTPLVDVTEEHVLNWMTRITGQPETIAAYVSAIHGLYRWMAVLARPRLTETDPTVILERPSIPEVESRPMLEHHYNLALACALSDPEMYLWLGLMGCSGLRCCEVAWLQVGNVEPVAGGGGYLHITGKSGKQRTVPIGAMLLLTMRPFLHGRGPLFTRPSDGKAHTPNSVSARTSEFLQGVGIPAPYRAHSMRHKFGKDYHAIDVDLYRQAKLMGHASVDTTRRYTQITPVEAARYIEELTTARLNSAARNVTDGYGRAA
jgi:site-specific recombinase XerD